MRSPKILQLLSICGLLAVLPGCFNYNESVEFDENGAGHLEYRFERGTQSGVGGFMQKMGSEAKFDNPVEDKAKMESEKPKGLKLDKFSKEDKEGGRTVFEGKISFDDIGNFAQWNKHDEIVRIWGHTTVTKSDDIRIFERKIIAPTKAEIEDAQKNGLNTKVVLKVKGPGKVLETNGKQQGENTVVWEGEFADFFTGKVAENNTLRARFQLPPKPGEGGMTNTILLGAVLLVVVIGAVIVLSRKKAAAGPKEV